MSLLEELRVEKGLNGKPIRNIRAAPGLSSVPFSSLQGCFHREEMYGALVCVCVFKGEELEKLLH